MRTIDDRVDPEGAQAGDADGRGAVGDLGGRVALGADGVGEQGEAGFGVGGGGEGLSHDAMLRSVPVSDPLPRFPVKPGLKFLLVEIDPESIEEPFPAKQQRRVIRVREAHGNRDSTVGIARRKSQPCASAPDTAFLSRNDATEFYQRPSVREAERVALISRGETDVRPGIHDEQFSRLLSVHSAEENVEHRKLRVGVLGERNSGLGEVHR